jgi:hypothetical protein
LDSFVEHVNEPQDRDRLYITSKGLLLVNLSDFHVKPWNQQRQLLQSLTSLFQTSNF